MVTYVIDASALLRLLLAEHGAGRVREILDRYFSGNSKAVISAVNWGEVVGKIFKTHGIEVAEGLSGRFTPLGPSVIPATLERASRAALISAEHEILYADAFGVELALDSAEHILVTADFDAKPAERFTRSKSLPIKPLH